MRDNSSTNGDTQHLSWTVRTLSQSTVAVFHSIHETGPLKDFKSSHKSMNYWRRVSSRISKMADRRHEIPLKFDGKQSEKAVM